jgi:3-deoxy-D-manno-octulosonic-acid transferase
MILSPRHPERFDEVAALCRRHPAAWKVSRASEPEIDDPDVLVLDTMGDLARVYGLGAVALVAGSFSEKVGGHPQIEAAVHSIPVVVGPHMQSQKEIDRLFAAPDSGCVRCSADTLAATLSDLFTNETKRLRLGAQARATATRNQGAARRSVDIIKRYLEKS